MSVSRAYVPGGRPRRRHPLQAEPDARHHQGRAADHEQVDAGERQAADPALQAGRALGLPRRAGRVDRGRIDPSRPPGVTVSLPTWRTSGGGWPGPSSWATATWAVTSSAPSAMRKVPRMAKWFRAERLIPSRETSLSRLCFGRAGVRDRPRGRRPGHAGDPRRRGQRREGARAARRGRGERARSSPSCPRPSSRSTPPAPGRAPPRASGLRRALGAALGELGRGARAR